ncbi:MAG: metal ABC transporter ATP-binding protein [Candidatus Nitrosocosmicus sp.]
MSLLEGENQQGEDKVVIVKDLNVRNGSDIILDKVSFEIKKGDFLGIIGPNGAGKTTLFKCMLGLNKNFTGTIKIFDKEIKKEPKEIYKKIGYIPQSNNLDHQFPATVHEVIELGAIGKKISKEKKKEIMDYTGISDYLDKRIGNLSGGQQQRVMITKALINEPELLILDEPGTAIDTNILRLFYKLLTKLNKEKKITIIWSSHDLDAVNLLSNKVACIYKKLLFHGGSKEFFSNENNIKKYTEAAMHIHIKNHFH